MRGRYKAPYYTVYDDFTDEILAFGRSGCRYAVVVE